MAQNWNMRATLVHPQGNFGSIAGLPPAARSRHGSSLATSVAAEMLDDLERDTVDFMDDPDGKYREPLVLPCRFPNLLVNGPRRHRGRYGHQTYHRTTSAKFATACCTLSIIPKRPSLK
jgi:hypothetical protein